MTTGPSRSATSREYAACSVAPPHLPSPPLPSPPLPLCVCLCVPVRRFPAYSYSAIDALTISALLRQMRVAGRASDPTAGPPSGRKPKPFSVSDAGGVAAALSTDDRGRASLHSSKTGRENPRFQQPPEPDTKPHSAHRGSGATRNTGSTASVGNVAHMKNLERSWNAEEDRSGAAPTGQPAVYKSGYSVDLMSTRELMELRRGIEASLDKRGVEPATTCVPSCHPRNA